MVVSLALLGIGDAPVLLEEAFDFIEIGFFGLVVLGAVLLGALEHQMLEIVGESRGFLGVVLSADAYGDESLQTGLFFVDGHIDFQTVVQGVDPGVHRISFYAFVTVAGDSQGGDDGCKNQSGNSFHFKQVCDKNTS